MKDKIIGDLNALFKTRGEFYAFFDAKIPKFAGTELFDFKALRAKNEENSANLISSRGESGENSANSTQSVDNVNLEQIYKLFHHYDYAIRKLLPSIYKAYEIDSEKDLSKDF